MSPELKRYLKEIEASGYKINNFEVAHRVNESITNGSTHPFDKLNELKEEAKKIETFNLAEVTKNFREELSTWFDDLDNLINNVDTDLSLLTEKGDKSQIESYKSLVRDAKLKAGILYNKKRTEEIDSTTRVREQIEELNKNDSLSYEEKMAEFQRLTYIQDRSTKKATPVAESLASKYDKEITLEIIDDTIKALMALYNDTVRMNVNNDVRKEIIDRFANVARLGNKYKEELNLHVNTKKEFDKILVQLGLKRDNELKIENPNEKEENEELNSQEQIVTKEVKKEDEKTKENVDSTPVLSETSEPKKRVVYDTELGGFVETSSVDLQSAVEVEKQEAQDASNLTSNNVSKNNNTNQNIKTDLGYKVVDSETIVHGKGTKFYRGFAITNMVLATGTMLAFPPAFVAGVGFIGLNAALYAYSKYRDGDLKISIPVKDWFDSAKSKLEKYSKKEIEKPLEKQDEISHNSTSNGYHTANGIYVQDVKQPAGSNHDKVDSKKSQIISENGLSTKNELDAIIDLAHDNVNAQNISNENAKGRGM